MGAYVRSDCDEEPSQVNEDDHWNYRDEDGLRRASEAMFEREMEVEGFLSRREEGLGIYRYRDEVDEHRREMEGREFGRSLSAPPSADASPVLRRDDLEHNGHTPKKDASQLESSLTPSKPTHSQPETPVPIKTKKHHLHLDLPPREPPVSTTTAEAGLSIFEIAQKRVLDRQTEAAIREYQKKGALGSPGKGVGKLSSPNGSLDDPTNTFPGKAGYDMTSTSSASSPPIEQISPKTPPREVDDPMSSFGDPARIEADEQRAKEEAKTYFDYKTPDREPSNPLDTGSPALRKGKVVFDAYNEPSIGWNTMTPGSVHTMAKGPSWFDSPEIGSGPGGDAGQGHFRRETVDSHESSRSLMKVFDKESTVQLWIDQVSSIDFQMLLASKQHGLAQWVYSSGPTLFAGGLPSSTLQLPVRQIDSTR